MNLGGFCAYNGAFAWLTQQPQSKFSGIFFRLNEKRYRVIEHLGFLQDVKTFSLDGTTLLMQFSTGKGTLHFTSQTECRITLPRRMTFDIVLDIKELYDDRVWGRLYTPHKDTKHPVITFEKTNDMREAPNGTYTQTIGFPGARVQNIHHTFIPRTYTYDASRNPSSPKRWVYRAVQVSATTFTIKIIQPNMRQKRIPVHTALDMYQVDTNGLAAGYPWFFEQWTRDELISLGGVMLAERYDVAQHVVHKYARQLGNAFIFPSKFPSSQLAAADGLGWLCVRLEQLFTSGACTPLFTPKKRKDLATRLAVSLELLWKHRGENGLIRNGPLETWMDTGWHGDTREGHCLEIQALTVAAYRLLELLSGQRNMKKQLYLSRIRQAFVRNGILLDRIADDFTRPNLALAQYVAPELFTHKEWEQFFDHALKKLWLPWGGVSSIQTDSALFCRTHTGENNQSYHRGDSWYWINHYFALALHRINAKKYKPTILKIKQASLRAQRLGVPGHFPEVSSAEVQSAQGCVAQLWSLATWIELAWATRRKQSRSINRILKR